MIQIHNGILTDIVDGMLDDLSVGVHESETVLVGNLPSGAQVHITVTKNKDEFLETYQGHLCVVEVWDNPQFIGET